MTATHIFLAISAFFAVLGCLGLRYWSKSDGLASDDAGNSAIIYFASSFVFLIFAGLLATNF